MKKARLNRLQVIMVIAILALTILPLPVAATPAMQGEYPDDLFMDGRNLFAQGRNEEARQKFEAALAGYRNIGDREGELTTLNWLGKVYNTLGEFDTALDTFQQALQLALELGDLNEQAMALNGIGFTLDNQGNFELAIDYYEQALVIIRELGIQEGEQTILHNIGTAYLALGQFDAALENLEQALALAQETDDLHSEALTLNSIGGVYSEQGYFKDALSYYQQALVIFQEIGYRIGEGAALNNIGVIYIELGQYEEALDVLEQALTIRQEIGDRAGEAATLHNLGSVYDILGRYDEAVDAYQQVLEIAGAAGIPQAEAVTLHGLGVVALNTEQYEDALTAFNHALEIVREIGERVGEGRTLSNIGLTYSYLGQYDLALTYLDKALKIQRAIGDRSGEAATLANIASVYEDMGEVPDAIDYYQQSIDLVEAIQGDIKVEELQASFTSARVDTYQRLINLLWSEGRYEEAYHYSERARARAFLNQLAGGRVDFRAGAGSALLERERDLRSRIITQQEALIILRNRPTEEWDTEAVAEAESRLTTLEAEYAGTLRDLQIQSPEVASLVSVDVAPLAEVQGLLNADTTLVEYFVSEERVLAFVVTQDGLEPVAIAVSREDLTAAIEDFRRFASLSDPYPASLRQLYEWLIAPLGLSTPLVGIIPHHELHYLPFAALTKDGRYFGDDHTLFTLPSASALRFLEEPEDGADTLLALGNPAIAAPLPALRFAEQEVEGIAALYGVEPLTGDEATEGTVYEQASAAEVLHLAAHGEYNPHNPLFSALHLAPDLTHDGRLEVHEIYGLDLTQATDLVVLSACSTQVGALSTGDEVVGLNRAFLYAGSPTVIASLWNVDDRATAQLMQSFYVHLRTGLSKADALRQAQIDVRAEYPHPYYWAAFVLTGIPGKPTEAAEPVEEPPSAPAPVEATPRRPSETADEVGGATETPVPTAGPGLPLCSRAAALPLGMAFALIAMSRAFDRRHSL